MAPFSVIVFGVVVTVDDSRIRSKTAPFSFENGLVWTRSKMQSGIAFTLYYNLRKVFFFLRIKYMTVISFHVILGLKGINRLFLLTGLKHY